MSETDDKWDDINRILGHTMIDPKKALAEIQLNAVRSFVKRVEQREKRMFAEEPHFHKVQLAVWHYVMLEELAAMEKERDEPTRPSEADNPHSRVRW